MDEHVRLARVALHEEHFGGVYGNISTWDTSRVADMSYLFCGTATSVNSNCTVSNREFNDDINSWDVSQVTTMYMMLQ